MLPTAFTIQPFALPWSLMFHDQSHWLTLAFQSCPEHVCPEILEHSFLGLDHSSFGFLHRSSVTQVST